MSLSKKNFCIITFEVTFLYTSILGFSQSKITSARMWLLQMQ